MKRLSGLLTLGAVVMLGSSTPAFAGSATDTALGLAAFAVFNQFFGGLGAPRTVVVQQPAEVISTAPPPVVYAPPPVVYAPPPPVVYAPPPVVYAPPPPRVVYAPPPVVYAPPPPIVYYAPPPPVAVYPNGYVYGARSYYYKHHRKHRGDDD
jgi:hypothetical protein